MSRLRRRSLGDDFGYTPGEQPRDGEGWIKLNTNESPVGPSPAVAAAVAGAAGELNRYPSPDAEPLRSAVAAYHGLRPSQVAVGNGADALIDACFRAFCDPGATVALTNPTYSLLPVVARLHNVDSTVSRLGEDGSIPASFAQGPAAVRFLVNPNTPTGTWREPDEVARSLAGAGGVVVIDEAYTDFAPRSCIELLAAQPTWIILRTLSKAHALAGLRVGYALGADDLVADIVAVADSYPVDRCAIAGAVAAIEDESHHRLIVEMVVSERARLSAALEAKGWHLIASHANYVAGVPAVGTAAETAAALRRDHVLVRHFDVGTRGLLRITVGRPAENDALLAALG